MQQKSEEELIEEEAVQCARAIWDSKQFDLPYTYCTSCPSDALKRPCVCNVVDGTALCPQHWIEEQVRKRMELLKHKQVITRVKLDLDDFSRI